LANPVSFLAYCYAAWSFFADRIPYVTALELYTQKFWTFLIHTFNFLFIVKKKLISSNFLEKTMKIIVHVFLLEFLLSNESFNRSIKRSINK
jgi:hypothetical protein